MPPNKPTKRQLQQSERRLRDFSPCRADLELLDDGSLLITLYRYRHTPSRRRMQVFMMTRVTRHGATCREAIRHSDTWDEFTAPPGSLEGWAGMPRSDAAVTRWMREGVVSRAF